MFYAQSNWQQPWTTLCPFKRWCSACAFMAPDDSNQCTQKAANIGYGNSLKPSTKQGIWNLLIHTEHICSKMNNYLSKVFGHSNFGLFIAVRYFRENTVLYPHQWYVSVLHVYILMYNTLHRITVVYSGSTAILVLETWYVVVWNTSTRGFLPNWLHGICSADKDVVSFCEILAPEASYLIDFTVYAVQTKMRCRFVKY